MENVGRKWRVINPFIELWWEKDDGLIANREKSDVMKLWSDRENLYFFETGKFFGKDIIYIFFNFY